jgi:2-polyprenyl-6-methoxyphenol hydroxylase-like FAD-dependent oxidoreductase
VIDDGTEVRAQFADGSEAAADIPVGADGLHSSVRAGLWAACAALRGLHRGVEWASYRHHNYRPVRGVEPGVW